MLEFLGLWYLGFGCSKIVTSNIQDYQVDGSRHKKVQTCGLGLAIVQLHGGWVEVENKEKGVVFKVVLPV